MVTFALHRNVPSFGYSATVAKRLMERGIETATHCFEYALGYRNEKGYGRIDVKRGKKFYTHRIAYELFNGEQLQEGDVVMHKCDNPKCFNPAHLVKGNILLNNLDKKKKGHYHVKHKRKRVILRTETVLAIRVALAIGSLSVGAISTACQCTWKQVSDIKNGVTWKHIQLEAKPKFTFDPGYDPFLDDHESIPLKSPRKRPERVPVYLRDSYEAYLASLNNIESEPEPTPYDPYADT